MRDWEPDLTSEWRRMSTQRWERQRAPRTPAWLMRVIVAAIIVFGFGYWARSAEPPGASTGLVAQAAPPTFQRQILLPPRPLVASPLDKLWSRTEKARVRGDVPTALIGLRTMAEDHPLDPRAPKAAFMLAALTPGAQERCLALAMVVGLAPTSAIATHARQRLPGACSGLF